MPKIYIYMLKLEHYQFKKMGGGGKLKQIQKNEHNIITLKKKNVDLFQVVKYVIQRYVLE